MPTSSGSTKNAIKGKLIRTTRAAADDGVTATFTSTPVNDFFVVPTAGLAVAMSGNLLIAGADAPPDTLTVGFSAPQSVLSVQFLLHTSMAATPFSLTAYLGATQVVPAAPRARSSPFPRAL